MTFIWSFIRENHQRHSSSLGWSRAIPRDFINILSGKNFLSAIYQGLILSELINLKTFVSILSGL
jgi:hypothetical protein